MGDSTIYFSIGFMSFDITKTVKKNEIWFELVERSKNLMWRVTFSAKVMQWIVGFFTRLQRFKVQQ